MKFTHIFFDLDHTLWDYDLNARKVLNDLYQQFDLQREIVFGPERFTEVFFKTNDTLWQQYNQGNIDRDEIRTQRFRKVMAKCGAPGFEKTEAMSEYFLFNCPRQKATIADATMILDYLSKRYHLSVVTNGFDDVQCIKLEACGLDKYFSHVFTSETTGHKKPSREIFDHAVKEVNAHVSTTLMIGDNHSTDIMGARNAGITPLLYNPRGLVKSDCQLQIKTLSELMRLL